MQDVYKGNDEIIAEIEADDTLEDDMKSTIISTILNGRWFSDDLDAYFGTPSLWE
jgi:para-nitrobenzyl esterase